ncbi:MAG: histidine phosphatase family protein [bacterium]
MELKDLLKDQHIDVVFCSDLKRAIDSAQLTFGNDIPIIIEPRLRECNYGTYNALPSDIVEPLQEKNIKERFPEGESYEDVKARITLFLDDVQKDYAGKTIAIVAHKAPQLALDVILGGKSREAAFADDRRKNHAWQPGWHYILP